MGKLEDILKNNPEDFNSSEPSEGHLQRFEQKLAKKSGNTNKIRLVSILKIAAVFLLLVMSGLWTYEKFNEGSDSGNETKVITLSDVSGEYNDAEIYYTSQIDKKYNELESLPFPGNEQEKEMILTELNQMDSVYTALQIDLNANPKDERVINAMIGYYKTKLKIMNQIIDRLNQLKQTKNTKYESTEI